MNVEKFNAEFRKHINENCMRYNGPVNLEVDEWDAKEKDLKVRENELHV